jgi:hypothetical protein
MTQCEYTTSHECDHHIDKENTGAVNERVIKGMEMSTSHCDYFEKSKILKNSEMIFNSDPKVLTKS